MFFQVSVIFGNIGTHPLTFFWSPVSSVPLLITPEVGIPLPFDVTPEEVEGFRERAKAACATILELVEAGAPVTEMTDEVSQAAHELLAAEKPIIVKKTLPAVILKLEAMLTEYDHEFLDAQRRISNFVTNRLMEESEDEDARVRLKALELLGKSVGTFSDKLEVTIKQKPVQDIEQELQKLLNQYLGEAIPVEAREVDNRPPSPAEIDLDAELGITDVDDDTDESDRDPEEES